MVKTEPIFKKMLPKGTREKLAVNFTDLVSLTSQKSEKTHAIQALRATSAQLARGLKTLGSLLKRALYNKNLQ